MNRLQLSQQSIVHPLMSNSFSKNKSKQNDPKYQNAIRPYINKQRKNSKRQIQKIVVPLPHQNSRSKSRRNDSYRNLQSTMNSKQLGDIYQELISLKGQYQSLKISYNVLMKQKETKEIKQKQNKNKSSGWFKQGHNEISKKGLQLQKASKQIEKYKSNVLSLQQELNRNKKQYSKTLDIEKNRNQKLKQTIQEKQLMIAFLRSQLANINNPISIDQSIIQHQFFFQNTAPISTCDPPNMSCKLSQNHSVISSIPLAEISKNPLKQKKKYQSEYDSLSFSQDKLKQFESVNSLLSNADSTVLTFTKKDVIILDDSPQVLQIFNDDQENCLTFQNRKEGQESKIIHNPVKTNTKRMLQINIDEDSKYQMCIKEGESLETRKRSNKQKKKSSKKRKDLKQLHK